MKNNLQVAAAVLMLSVLPALSLSARSGPPSRKGVHEVELSVSLLGGIRSRMETDVDLWNRMYYIYRNWPQSEQLPRYALPENRVESMPYIGAAYRYRMVEWLAMGVDAHYAGGSFPVKWSDGSAAWDCRMHYFRLLFSSRFYWYTSALVELYSEIGLGTTLVHGNAPSIVLSPLPVQEQELMKDCLSRKQSGTKTLMDVEFRLLGLTVGRSRGFYGKMDGGFAFQETGYLRVGIGYRF